MSQPPDAVVLLSVKPPHVQRLLGGTKTVELRRRSWRVQPGSVVLLYASGATRAVLGSVVVESTEAGTADDIWDRYGAEAEVTRCEFDAYFTGAPRAVAIRVRAARSLGTPLSLAELRRRWPRFAAPQSFRYVEPAELSHILNGERSALLADETQPRNTAI